MFFTLKPGKTLPFAMVLLFRSLCPSVAEQAAQKPGFEIVSDGKATAAIVTPAAPSQKVQQAARILQDYIRRMSGASLAIETESVSSSNLLPIYVGAIPEGKVSDPYVRQDRNGTDRYQIRVDPSYIALIGNDAGERRGSVFAVYDLLERLGCGWYGPDPLWHVVPRRDTLRLSLLDVREEPAFAMRTIHIIDDPELKDAWRLTGRTVNFSSTVNRLVPRDVYEREHPDYYGESQICHTHPEVIEIVAARLAEKIEKAAHDGIVPLSVTQADTGGFCNCARCRSVGNISARLLYMANGVSDILSKDFEDRFSLTFIAYWYAHDPPEPLYAARPGVVVMMVNEGNHAHPLTLPEPFYIRLFARRSNTREIRALQGWRKTGAGLGIYEWWIPGCGSYAWKRMPWYAGETTLANLRYWRDLGIEHLFYLTWYELDDGFPLRWPLYYMAARGMWNPDADAEETLSAACMKLYGPAAQSMLGYYRLFEDAMSATSMPAGNWDLPSPETVYSKCLFTEADAYLARALLAAPDSLVRSRIREEQSLWRRAMHTLERLRSNRLEYNF
jgi:hypothetical protein